MFKRVNGSLNDSSNIRWNGKGYTHYSEKEVKPINIKLSSCVAKLYYERPETLPLVFSHTFSKIVFVKKVSKNEYILKLSDGKENRYFYNQEGICTKIRVDGIIHTDIVLLK